MARQDKSLDNPPINCPIDCRNQSTPHFPNTKEVYNQNHWAADSRHRFAIPVSYFHDLICLIYILYWGVHCDVPGVCLVYLCDAWACVLFMYAVYLLRLWAVCKMQTRQITHSILFSVLEWGHPITWHQAWKDNEESKCKEHEPEREHYILNVMFNL